MKKLWNIALATALAVTSLGAFGCGDNDPKNNVTVTVWHYYNGAQKTAFDNLVKEFNEGQGAERGITVEAKSQSNVTDLTNAVIAAANNEPGAEEIPNIFASYSDTAYEIDKMNLVADISGYFTESEKIEYIDMYLKEGDLDGNGSLKIFPIGKATEIFMLNKTDWDVFAAACGKTYGDLDTVEELVATAEVYYNWTEETYGEGKALFGRDAVANYMFVGAKQLGVEILSVKNGVATLNFPKETVKTLWDNYYKPFVQGYFFSEGKYRSDNVQSGDIIGFIGSSTSEAFFPKGVEVEGSDDELRSIEYDILPAPQFANAVENVAVQQGAGMVVTKSTEEEIKASVEFLKWFTDIEQNVPFAIDSCYMPVKEVVNDMEKIERIIGAPVKGKALKVSIETVANNTMYTPPATKSGNTIRNILETSMSDKAAADRAAIAAGTLTVEECLADATFDAWYADVAQRLEETFNS